MRIGEPRIDGAAGALGAKAVWLALAALFLVIGLQKLTAYEAGAVAPFARSSPLLGWAYRAFGVRGASTLFAAIEIPSAWGSPWAWRGQARCWPGWARSAPLPHP